MINRIPTPADPTGGAVGGASNLTTVGAIPYVSSAGVLNQDAAALFWDATNDRLGLGTATPTGILEANGSSPAVYFTDTGTSYVQLAARNNTTTFYWGLERSGGAAILPGSTGYAAVFNQAGAYPMQFGTGNAIRMTIDSTGNIGIGTAGPVGKVEIVGAGAGAKSLLVRGNSSNDANIQEWQTNAGTALAAITSTGGVRPIGVLASALPAAAAGNAGSVQYVTDALGPVVGVTVVGGGAVPVLVWSTGAAWHVVSL